MIAPLRACLVLLSLAAAGAPAEAQWMPVPQLPAVDVFSVWAKGDTIVAGVDTAVHVSTDGGATWTKSARVAAGISSVETVRVRNGRLHAGTFGQGVFVSENLGASWSAYSQGLSGGIADTHLFIKDLEFRGDSAIVATAGAGCWVRNVAGAGPSAWSRFGDAFEPNQASSVNDVAVGGGRLLASAGGNGTVFFRDRGAPDWTLSWLDDAGIAPGLSALAAAWTGGGWVVGSDAGVFTSPSGEAPWSFVDVGLGTLFAVSFAPRGRDLFANFATAEGSTVMWSTDDGATWLELDTLPFVFTYGLARAGTDLYAARSDGLWRRSIATVSAPSRPGRGADRRFALAGRTPVRDDVRFRFELDEPAAVTLQVFDVAGRRVGGPIGGGAWPAGVHEVSWSARDLAPGVYLARLAAGGRSSHLRFVRVR